MAEEDIFSTASNDLLVQLVKISQKRGMKGGNGDWKEFLKVHDKRSGANVSDPAKRDPEDLRAFLRSFKEYDDVNSFARLIKSHSNIERTKELLQEAEFQSPELRLVRLTLEHRNYPLSYSFPSHEEGWFVTKLGKKAKGRPSNKLLAVDCEMVLCDDGTEALVKICVVDRELQIILHEFVKPDKQVSDYRTEITGVSAKDLDGITFSVTDVQKSLRKLLSCGEILVGHSLSQDLKAMKVDHARVIDTSFIFKYGDEHTKRLPSLNDLCKAVLGYELRKEGAAHNCADDACAAMRLVLAKIEHGFDDVIPASDVPQSAELMLLVHRIPRDLPQEELRKAICGDFTIEIKPRKKGVGDKYSALAIFKTPEEARNAYENVKGVEEKDTYGRRQKPFFIKQKSGPTPAIYIRKMKPDSGSQVSIKQSSPMETSEDEAKGTETSSQVSTKRPSPIETSEVDAKRLKTDKSAEVFQGGSCLDHEKEIERLKNLVHERDQEISSLYKIVTALTKKQGLA